ncbi:MAG: hypothetical protein BMS9Abin28_2148 [Anaerolineae bacterium]|nr:MAG: hypothetical protein BMS9Abin28_2148 [Anaerolineae bacterium]
MKSRLFEICAVAALVSAAASELLVRFLVRDFIDRFVDMPADTFLTMGILRIMLVYRPGSAALLSVVLALVMWLILVRPRGATRVRGGLLFMFSALGAALLSFAWSALELLENRLIP